jgi:hypothetical protein
MACKGVFAGRGSDIQGPRRVIAADVFACREWRETVSADGVRSQVSTLLRRALVN